jgi:hypothetical protein
MKCISPPLSEVPDGDWFCVVCTEKGITKSSHTRNFDFVPAQHKEGDRVVSSRFFSAASPPLSRAKSTPTEVIDSEALPTSSAKLIRSATVSSDLALSTDVAERRKFIKDTLKASIPLVWCEVFCPKEQKWIRKYLIHTESVI